MFWEERGFGIECFNFLSKSLCEIRFSNFEMVGGMPSAEERKRPTQQAVSSDDQMNSKQPSVKVNGASKAKSTNIFMFPMHAKMGT